MTRGLFPGAAAAIGLFLILAFAAFPATGSTQWRYFWIGFGIGGCGIIAALALIGALAFLSMRVGP